ncbi:MAG: FtsX-like permease family protein [Myxococcaceae bacterium]|nr:FtsX-like permease family protein [Myxococcaceae bacterium]
MSRLPRLAVRNVGRNRRRTLITGAAIFVCVTLVIVLKGFITGAQDLMLADVVEGRTGALQIHQKGYVDNIEAVPTRMNLPYTPALIAKIKAVPGVKGVTGRLQFNGLVSNGRAQTMFIGKAIDVATEKEACPRADAVLKPGGQPLVPLERAALVGFELANSFQLAPGGTVNLLVSSPEGRQNSLDVKVKALTSSSFPFENKRVLTVPLKTAQELLGLDGRVTEYAVAIDDLNRIDETRAALAAALGPEFEVHTWAELQTFVRDIINRQSLVMGMISLVLFVIALTVIANTMLMSVFERVREIGTLLAVGVKRLQVLQLFIIEAAVLGLLGGVAGVIAGRLALLGMTLKGIEFEMPGTSTRALLVPHVTPGYIVGAVVVATLGAVLAASWPSFRASRLNPVDALRNG